MDIEPVPEHWRPVLSSLGSAFASHRSKREIYLTPFAERNLVGFGGFSNSAPVLFACASPAPTGGQFGPFGCSTFGSAAPASTAGPFGCAPAPAMTGGFYLGSAVLARGAVKQGGPPSLSWWLRMSSGGLYLFPSNEAMEVGKINILVMDALMQLASSVAQKVEAALKSEFGWSFQTVIEDEKNSALSLINSISSEHEDLLKFKKEKIDAHVHYLMLKIIECAIFLHPRETGIAVYHFNNGPTKIGTRWSRLLVAF